MPQPRYTQIDIDATADYQVISSCVRRAFLCGYDRATDRCFDHRKAWVCEKLAALTAIFAVRLHSYAILSNHFPVCGAGPLHVVEIVAPLRGVPP